MAEKLKHFVVIFVLSSIIIFSIRGENYNINDFFRTIIGVLSVTFLLPVEEIEMNKKLEQFIFIFIVACLILYIIQGFELDRGNIFGIFIGDIITTYIFPIEKNDKS